MKDKIREALQFQDLTEEEKQKRGILGRLYGPCASIVIPTRNGRFYQESLWEHQFQNNDILKELIKNGGIPMELDHPIDREETCSDRIAAMMPELPKKDKDGHLICYVDIIDTPLGKIAYQLAKYGFKLGISSRGTGDVIQDENGEDIVDPETYDLTTFDLVLVPSVEDARLTMAESLQNKKSFSVALTESLNKANPDDRKIMEETLNNLGIDYKQSLREDVNTSNGADNIDIKEDSIKKGEVSDTESTVLVKSLQEALSSKLLLEKQLQELQEKLAVSDTKTKKLEEELIKTKNVIVRLGNLAQSSKELKEENQSLKSQLEEKTQSNIKQSDRISKLVEKLDNNTNASKCLNEDLEKKNKEIKELKEKHNTEKAEYENKLTKLNEQLLDEKSSSSSKIKELESKLDKSIKLTEKYKGYVKTTVDRYIKSKAVMLGISDNEIKNRLSESYTLSDIDKICEDLQVYNLRMSKLPFNLDKDTKVRITESKEKQYAPEKISPEDDVAGLVKFIEG